MAARAVESAESGRKARAIPGANGLIPDETHFLHALQESVEAGKVPADELVERFQGAWGGDLSRIFDEFSY